MGGSGDVDGVFAFPRLVRRRDTLIASFTRCKSSNIPGETAAGSLREALSPGHDHGRRFFEDKLFDAGLSPHQVFVICLKDEWSSVAKGLDALATALNPDHLLHVDLGGDGLVLGYEEEMGSYVEDTLARAALYYLAGEYSSESYTAVGLLGLEGGGDVLNMHELVGDLLYLHNHNALLGIHTPAPGQREIRAITRLLKRGDSTMLTILLDVLRGYLGKRNTIYFI